MTAYKLCVEEKEKLDAANKAAKHSPHSPLSDEVRNLRLKVKNLLRGVYIARCNARFGLRILRNAAVPATWGPFPVSLIYLNSANSLPLCLLENACDPNTGFLCYTTPLASTGPLRNCTMSLNDACRGHVMPFKKGVDERRILKFKNCEIIYKDLLALCKIDRSKIRKGPGQGALYIGGRAHKALLAMPGNWYGSSERDMLLSMWHDIVKSHGDWLHTLPAPAPAPARAPTKGRRENTDISRRDRHLAIAIARGHDRPQRAATVKGEKDAEEARQLDRRQGDTPKRPRANSSAAAAASTDPEYDECVEVECFEVDDGEEQGIPPIAPSVVAFVPAPAPAPMLAPPMLAPPAHLHHPVVAPQVHQQQVLVWTLLSNGQYGHAYVPFHTLSHCFQPQ